MCTEYITKHRLFPKSKTEFYKVLLADNYNRYFSPYRSKRYIIGERCEASEIMGFKIVPVAKLPDDYRTQYDSGKCNLAIHLFENIEDAKVYLSSIGIFYFGFRYVIGTFRCDSEDFFCCGLTRSNLISSKSTWLPTACYNAATLVRVEEIDV